MSTSRVGQITRSILDSWNDDEDDAQPETETTEETPADEQQESEVEVTADADVETPTEEEAEEADDDGEAGEQEETEEADEEEEAETEPEGSEEEKQAQERDAAVEAFLAKYGGDVDAALKGASEMMRTFGRRDDEKNLLVERVSELEEELAHLQTFGGLSPMLNAEQHAWVGEAIDSGNPRAYVQQAIRAREYGLARAVCDVMAQDAPYDAMRLAQAVDAAEISAAEHASRANTNGGGQLDHNALMGILVDNFPDMPQYEQQMVTTLASLGAGHPLVEDARSQDPETAARGIIGIFEIAKAQRTSVDQVKQEVDQRNRKKADDARKKAVVSSSTKAPSTTETPRTRNLMPGLTLEQLEDEWARD